MRNLQDQLPFEESMMILMLGLDELLDILIFTTLMSLALITSSKALDSFSLNIIHFQTANK